MHPYAQDKRKRILRLFTSRLLTNDNHFTSGEDAIRFSCTKVPIILYGIEYPLKRQRNFVRRGCDTITPLFTMSN